MAVARLQLLDEVEDLLNTAEIVDERWASEYFLETHSLPPEERAKYHDIGHNSGTAWGKKIGRLVTALRAEL